MAGVSIHGDSVRGEVLLLMTVVATEVQGAAGTRIDIVLLLPVLPSSQGRRRGQCDVLVCSG